jgi:hypothetical protein
MHNDDSQPNTPDPEQQARDAWADLPQQAPSREAMPPAGGGLMAFWGLFAGLWRRGEREDGQQQNRSEDHREG